MNEQVSTADTQPYLTDRSRVLAYQDCPRRRYWAYEYKGRGVAPTRRDLYFSFGGAVHKGLEDLLLDKSVESAVESGRSTLRGDAEGQGLLVENSSRLYETVVEQGHLVEALLRAFYLQGLPLLRSEYEVLEVEREDIWHPSPGLAFMARADGLLRGRADGLPYVLSFKTAKQTPNTRQSDQDQTDVQGMSEVVAIGERTGVVPAGVQMFYLVKGRREEFPRGSGIYQSATSLVHPWTKCDKSTGFRRAFAHSWAWRDYDGNHTLGKGWTRCNIWDYTSIGDWIEALHSCSIQPHAGDFLREVLVMPPAYSRDTDELESWKTQVQTQEEGLAKARAEYPNPTRQELDVLYHQHRRSCLWPTKCSMWDICFGPRLADSPDGPESSGLYQWRIPHHELEVERWKQSEENDASSASIISSNNVSPAIASRDGSTAEE